jgi:hypothetical protein
MDGVRVHANKKAFRGATLTPGAGEKISVPPVDGKGI